MSETVTLTPAPGDVVLYADGSRGVIDGPYFGTDFEDGRGPVALTIKGASAFRGESSRGDGRGEYVSCSGGPCPFVPLAGLTPAGTMTQRFWRWKDWPRAGGGEDYTLEVAAWRTEVTP